MKNYLKKNLFLLMLLVGVNSVFATNSQILGPGDIVKVSVFQNPDLDTEARISDKGTINFPLIGEIEISGMGEREAEAKIASTLKNGGYLKFPQVTLIVDEYSSQQVSVLGEVKNPGKYSLAEGNTIIDVIALAGGITAEGSDKVILSRFGNEGVRREIDINRVLGEGELETNWVLEGKDVVFVPRMDVFYINGEVQRPGVYRLEKGLTVMQAISIGGSLTERGTLRGVTVLRHTGDQEMQTLEIQLTDPVMPRDVITVEESLF